MSEYRVRDADAFTESAGRKGSKIWLKILLWVLGVAIWLRLIEALKPGVIADLLSFLKARGIAIWNIFCSAGYACADLMDYVKRWVSSG